MPSYPNQIADVPESFESQLKDIPSAPPTVEDNAPEGFSFWEFLERYPHPDNGAEKEVTEATETNMDEKAVGDRTGYETD
jgi:hypothetical protein